MAGFWVVFFFPVISYLIKLKQEAENPILAHVTQMDWQNQNNKLYQDVSIDSLEADKEMVDYALQTKDPSSKKYWN